MNIRYVIALVVISLYYSEGLFLNECSALLDNSDDVPSWFKRPIEVDTCPRGRMYWNNPQGASRQVVFEASRGTFTVCITGTDRQVESYTRADTMEVINTIDYAEKGEICMTSLNHTMAITVNGFDKAPASSFMAVYTTTQHVS